MRRILVTILLVGLVALPGAARLAPAFGTPPEWCQAANPGPTTCSFTVTHNTNGPVSGIAGRGSWTVTVQRGKTKITMKSSPAGDPEAVAFMFQTGDKVTAKALTPGTFVIVGGE